MAIPTNYIDKITKDGESRVICPAADKVRVDNENFEGADLNEVLNEVAEAIDEAGSGGYAPPEGGIPATDLAADVQAILNDVANKVDKVTGKGLSSEDFTAALKDKLEALDPYTKAQVDAAIQQAVEGLGSGSVDSVTINGVNHEPVNGIVDLGTVVGQQGQKGEQGDTLLVDDNFDPVTMIVNGLDDSDGTVALSARQGKILKQAVDRVQANLQAVLDALANMAFTGNRPTLTAIDWTGGTFYATINKTLSGCTATDNTTNGQIAEGSTLTMTLTASSGFTLTGAIISVTNSRGQNVSYTLANNVLTIANVVGTINISVTAIGVFSVTNSDTHVDLTTQNMSPTTGSSWSGTLSIKSSVSGYGLSASPNVTMGGSSVDFSATGNSWNQSTGAMTIGSVTGDIVIVSASSEVVAHAIRNHFINMASSNPATMVEDGQSYSTVLSLANNAIEHNKDLRVFIDGELMTAGTDYTYDTSTGALSIPAAKITGDIDICMTASTGKMSITVKAGMSTTVKVGSLGNTSYNLYNDTVDASASADDVTQEIVATKPTNYNPNGYYLISSLVVGTKDAVKSVDFGGCKTEAGGTKFKMLNYTALEHFSGLAYVENTNPSADKLATSYFSGDTSLQGTLDLMPWNCDGHTSISNIISNCPVDEVIMPYLPSLTTMYQALAGAKAKRIIFSKTGTITTFRSMLDSASGIEFIDLSKVPVALVAGTGNNDPWYTFKTSSNISGVTMKIGEMDVSAQSYAPPAGNPNDKAFSFVDKDEECSR